MSNTFILIAQQPLEFKGRHYEPGDRFVAHALESAGYQRRGLTKEAPQDEQRAHGAHPERHLVRKRGRPRKVVTESET